MTHPDDANYNRMHSPALAPEERIRAHISYERRYGTEGRMVVAWSDLNALVETIDALRASTLQQDAETTQAGEGRAILSTQAHPHE